MTTRTTSFEGQCREMTTFDAGTVGFGAGTPVIFNETVHGPVIGYATVDGERVALSSSRSTRNREAVSGFGFAHLNDGTVDSVESFYDAANEIEFSFNWFYADKDDVAMFSSGRIPDRHPQVDARPADEGQRQVRVAWLPVARTSTRTALRRRTARSSTGTTSRLRAGRPRTTSGATAR